jgi:hypothetical protein
VIQPAQERELYTAWREEHGALVDGPETIECIRCGLLVCGDGAPVPVVCWSCTLEEAVPESSSSDDPLEN